jgi:hypothetical protein
MSYKSITREQVHADHSYNITYNFKRLIEEADCRIICIDNIDSEVCSDLKGKQTIDLLHYVQADNATAIIDTASTLGAFCNYLGGNGISASVVTTTEKDGDVFVFVTTIGHVCDVIANELVGHLKNATSVSSNHSSSPTDIEWMLNHRVRSKTAQLMYDSVKDGKDISQEDFNGGAE